jgi:hypothetical protein
MTQYIIDIGAYPDDGQGSPLRTAFDYTNENFNQIFAAGPVLSNIQIGNNTITTTVLNSNLILSPSGIGRIQFNNTLFPRLDNVYDIGTPSLRFNSIYLGTGGINSQGGISTSGNITAGYFFGNGSQLTGIVATTGSQVTNGNSNINIPAAGSNIFVTVNGTSNVVTFANTGAYVAGTVSATGNIAGNYILGNGALLTGINIGYGNSNVADFLPTYTGNLVSLTGPVTTTANVTGGNLRTAGQISATGNITGGNINTGRLNAGYITTGTTISAVGNIATSSYFIGDGSLLTGINANYGNANVAAFLPTYTGNLVSLTGPVTTTSNITGGNLRTAGQISAAGNITGGNVDASRVNANTVTVASTISAAGNITGNNLIGTTVTATTVTAIANVVGGNITTSGQVSATGNVQGGNLNAPGGTVTSAIVSATGRVQGGNLVTTGYITATGNITGGNVDTGNVHAGNINVDSVISAIGNIYGNNLVGRSLSVTGNVSAGNVSISGTFGAASLSASGNITGGNLLTTGLISSVGNISGGYFVGNGALLTGITVSAGTSILNGNSNVVVAANGNVTISSAGVSNVASFANTGAYIIGEISATGNVTGTYLLGNGAFITGLPAGYSNADVANYLPTYSGNLVSLTGPVTTTANITGNYFVGNGSLLTGVSASDVNANALTGNTLSSNVLYSSLTQVGNLANLSVTGNATVGNVLTGGLISATGNVTGNYILGNGALLTGVITSVANINNGTSNVTVVSSGGNVTVGVGGTSNIAVFATTGEYITGLLSASGNIIGGNLVTAGLATISGNITGGNVLTGGLISATANISGGNINTAGQISATGNISGNYFIGNGSQLTGVAASSVNANALIGNTLSSNVLYSSLTQVGNLANLSVVGNTVSGNLLTGGLVSATGNATVGNLSTAGLITVSGNITGGNLSTAGLITASGNISGNNVFATGFASVTGNVIAGNVNTSNIRPTTGELTITTASGNLNLQPAGNIVLANTFINSVAYPEQDTDAATKLYVDNMVSSALTFHSPVYAATTTTLAVATGGTISYTQPNGVSNGVGAYLSTTGSFNLIDTANVQTAGTRILVKNEGNAVYNGVYTWSNATVIVRSVDADQYGSNSAEQLSLNDYFFTTNGNVNAGSAFVVNEPTGTITFGTSNISFALFSQTTAYTANVDAGLSLIGTQFNAKVDNNTTAFDVTGNIIVKAGANLTTPNIGAATGTSLSLIGNVNSGNVNTTGLISAAGNVTGNYFIGNISQATGALGNNINMGTNSAGALVSNAVTLTTTTSVTNGIALLNQVLGKLVPPSPPNFPGANTLSLSGIATYRMANITQVDNTPGANKAVAAGTSVANVLRVATYATNTIANVGPGDSGTVTAVRNGANVGNVTLNAGASPSANGTYGGNLVISNNFDYNAANANITAGFWYVFSSRVSGATAPAGWNELYIADSGTGNTNTTVWYYDNSSPSTPAFSSTSMTPPGSANLLYSSTIPHYTNNNNFTIAFNVANISGNMYPTSNTLASGASGGAFTAPVTINYNASNIGSNVLNSFASASANTTASITTGFGGSTTGPSMSVNNSYATGTLTLTAALANTVLYKSGTATAIDESNVVINTTIGTGSGNAYRIINPGAGNTPPYTGSEAAFNSQSSTLQTYDATVVGVSTSGVLKHDQTNYSTGYLPAGPNLSSGRTGTQYFTMKFVRTAVSKFDIKYTGNIAGMWVALPGSVIDSSSSANGWINMAVAYGGAGYPGVNAPGNGSDGCAVGGTVTLNTSVTNSSKTCTFGTVSSSSTATNEIYVRIALTAGQSVTALTLETASN